MTVNSKRAGKETPLESNSLNKIALRTSLIPKPIQVSGSGERVSNLKKKIEQAEKRLLGIDKSAPTILSNSQTETENVQTVRELQGFRNPCGFWVRVTAGTGTGPGPDTRDLSNGPIFSQNG